MKLGCFSLSEKMKGNDSMGIIDKANEIIVMADVKDYINELRELGIKYGYNYLIVRLGDIDFEDSGFYIEYSHFMSLEELKPGEVYECYKLIDLQKRGDENG